MGKMIEVRDLHFWHKGEDSPVLKGIEFEASPHEITVILGPNGSGKTTLLKCILRLWEAQRGEVFINGRSIKVMGRGEVAKNVAIVPQDHEPPFPYSVFDVVLLGRVAHIGLLSSPSRRDKEAARRALEALGIERLADRPYTKISGGERQLVLIARCLAQEAPVMLLDEPTAHLDFRNQVMVLTKVKSIAKEKGLAVLMTLHDPNLALLFSDRVLLLNAGKVVARGSPNEVITEENIKKVYGLDVAFISQDGMRMVCPKVQLRSRAL